MSNGIVGVDTGVPPPPLRPGMHSNPYYCRICGYARESNTAFTQTLRGYVTDYYGGVNPVYHMTCVNCGNVTWYPYNTPGMDVGEVPDEWVGVGTGSVGIGTGAGLIAVASVVWVPPVVTGVTPDSTRRGSDDTIVVVTGDDFQDGAVVMIGATELTTTGVDMQNLRAIIPAEMMTQAGTLWVGVQNPDGQTSGTVGFTVYTGVGP